MAMSYHFTVIFDSGYPSCEHRKSKTKHAPPAGCIQNAYDTLAVAPQVGDNGLQGGNYNFDYTQVMIQGSPIDPTSFGCPADRCGIFDPLHFHTKPNSADFGTFHVDTANPFFIPVGSLAHLVVDIIMGNTIWASGIPR